MDDSNRGKIIHEDWARQLHDFSKLKYFGKITPTDLDGFIDFGDQAFIFIEDKYKEAKMPFGQKLALERLADCVAKTGKFSAVIVCKHDCNDEMIDTSLCMVTRYYWQGKWHFPKKSTIVKEAINYLLKYWNLDRYIIKSKEKIIIPLSETLSDKELDEISQKIEEQRLK